MTPTPTSIRDALESALPIDAIVELVSLGKARVWYLGKSTEQEVADRGAELFVGYEFWAVDVAGLSAAVSLARKTYDV